MSSFDPELLRHLAEADAERPPAPGADFSPARLTHLAARRARRQLLAGAAATLCATAAFALWPRPATADAESPPTVELRALQTELAHLTASLRDLSRSTAAAYRPAARAAGARRAADLLRCELAGARADAALAKTWHTPTRENK